MKVYLDLLILDNFCADAALLYCAVRTVKGEAKLWRIALSALLGLVSSEHYTPASRPLSPSPHPQSVRSASSRRG